MRTFTTYQDMEAHDGSMSTFISESIKVHQASSAFRIANSADLYDAQMNETINNYVQTIINIAGESIENVTASNNKIASNFFNVLNTQRCAYSIGRGISFASASGTEGDKTKEALGDSDFDAVLYDAAYAALKHGISFVMVNLDGMYVFPLTEFVPIWDEETGALRAGIRYWQLSSDRPMTAVLYEEDGYTTYRGKSSRGTDFDQVAEKKAYKTTYSYAPADAEPSVIGEENYGALPIVPFFASKLRQSTLVGLRESIDSYDLIKSGFANDVTDCAQIYWLIENYGGMSDKELAKFRDRMLLNHMAVADTSQGGKVTPYTQEIPYQARESILEELRSGMYQDFCALDTKKMSAGAKTATEIQTAYQPVDNKASEFEKEIAKGIKQILSLLEIDDSPVFTRDKVSNQLEQVQTIVAEAPFLDEETVLRKLPNITPDEVDEILARRDAEDAERFAANPFANEGEQGAQNAAGGE